MTSKTLTIHAQHREARLGGEALQLGARAFDVLRLLHENAGEVVSKQALLDGVWGGLTVEEGNLTVQISSLRRALGTDMIRTVPGVGYMLAQHSAPSDAIGPTLPDIPSLAVLPFANLTGAPERDYFVDGIATDLIATLSRVSGLFVIAATSSFRYRGQSVDLASVGRELGVRYLLEGSVQQAGTSLRVTVQLVIAQTGHAIWSERFSGSTDDLFALQDALAEKVSSAIEPTLLTAEATRSASKPTDSLKAYDLYLRAMVLVDGVPTAEAFAQALELLDRAIGMDPGFALAKAVKCMAYMRARGSRLISFENSRPAEAIARDLLNHESDDPHVLAYAGMTHAFFAEDKARGAQAVRKALRLAPNSCHILNIAGWTLSYVGAYGEAIQCLERSLRLDPIGTLTTYAHAGYGAVLMFDGRIDEAIVQLEQVCRASPRFGSGQQWLLMAYWAAGREDEARKVADALKSIDPDISLAASIETTPHRRPEQLALLEAAFRGVGLPG